MKTKVFKHLSLLLIAGLLFGLSEYASGVNYGWSSGNDTASLNRYTRRALIYSHRKDNIGLMKADIDSAETICRRERIEIPPLLRLARAQYLFLTGDFNNSSQEAILALKLSQNSNNWKVYVTTCNFLGRYNLKMGFFKESLDNFNKAIELAQKYKLKGSVAKSYDGIADVYKTLGDLDKYRSCLQSLITSSSKEKDTMGLENGLFRLGSTYSDTKRNFVRADSLLRACLEIGLTKRDTGFIALSLANMGWNFYNEKKYDKAIESYNLSLKYSLKSKRYSNAANAFGNLGTIYRDLGQTHNALENYSKSIGQAQSDSDFYTLNWVYHDMSEMYLRKRDTADAYRTYILFKKYSDRYITMNNSQGQSEAKIRYEADTHNKEMQLLSLKLLNQKRLILGSSILFILCLAVGVLLYSRSRINNKRKISEMKSQISEMTQANLRQQMNPHFIFNTLNSIQYYMYQHDKLATNTYLTKFSSLMRKVLENSRHTSIPLRDEMEALKLYLELEMIRFKDKIDYEIKIDDEIDTLLYKVPAMLIQPYVENSISHGLIPCEGKGLLKINLKLEDKYICCIIEDNGIGREAARQNVKMNGNNHHSLGTQIVTSRLDLVNALYGTNLRTIYTDLKKSNGEPEGTRVEIHIPILS